jgi:hypothetical protein
MELWNFVAGGAALGVIAGFWDKIKAVLWKGANLFVQQVEITTEHGHAAMVDYLAAHYPRSRYYDRLYGAYHEHQRDGRYALVPYEQFGNRTILFWDGWRPFFFSNAQEKAARKPGMTGEGSESTATRIHSTLTFLRGTIDVEAILRGACERCNKLTWAVTTEQELAKNRYVIHYVPGRGKEEEDRNYGANGLAWYQQPMYRLLMHAPDQLGKPRNQHGRALDNLIFPQRIKDLIREIELWRGNRAWYVDKGIPWKRGWLLYGPPGTGKTALARAFAEDLNLPIYVYNLAELSNHELQKAWAEMQVNVPCIALIEDIDNVFHGRENVARKNGLMPFMMPRQPKEGEDDRFSGKSFTPLTFDCLLNCLDGVERADGVFTIITTNDLSKVDPALGQPRKHPDGSVEFISTRPGRIDKAVELSFMEPGDKKKMAKRILGEYPDQHRAMVEFIDRYPELQETPAQFQERCGQIALACFWNEQQHEPTSPCLNGGAWHEGLPVGR